VVQSLPSLDQAQIRSIVHVAKSRCAFVNFKDRASAEMAAHAWAAGFEIDEQPVTVKWGRSKNSSSASSTVATSSTAAVVA